MQYEIPLEKPLSFNFYDQDEVDDLSWYYLEIFS